MQSCPCGSNKRKEDCCALFISGQSIPKTPEELMRSRYTAYSQANMNYIAETMRGSVADGFDPIELEQWSKNVTWLGLNVIDTKTAGSKGWVEFIARYAEAGHEYAIHEISEFHLENDHWFYADRTEPRIGRNDPCPCGSGKKFKKCCGFAGN